MTQDDFLFVDFEGDPSQPLDARRALHTPLRDLCSLLGSLVEAVGLAAARCAQPPSADALALANDALRQAVLQSYAQAAVAAGLWPYAPAFEADTPLRLLFEQAAVPTGQMHDAAHPGEDVAGGLAGATPGPASAGPGRATQALRTGRARQ